MTLTAPYLVCTSGALLSAEGAHVLVRASAPHWLGTHTASDMNGVNGRAFAQKLLGMQLAEFHITLLCYWHKSKFTELVPAVVA